MKEERGLLIKVPYDIPYVYKRRGSGPQTYIAKLSELDVIAERLHLSKEEALELLLNLIKKRLKKTRVNAVQQTLEAILSDPASYFY